MSQVRALQPTASKRLPQWRQMYQTARWKRYSVQFRDRNPICCECELQGKLEPTGAVDHRIPHRGDYDLFWDPKNHQPLCKTCHDLKSSRESRGHVVDWVARPNWWVLGGKPGSGKSTLAETLGLPVWDLDREAARMGVPMWPRPKAMVDHLMRKRQEWISQQEMDGSGGVVIVTHEAPAFRIAKDTKARLVWCWW